MAKVPDFDVDAAHKHFSVHCFNQAWDLIDKEVRTAEEDRLMVLLNQASIYHWLQRGDCTHQHLSVGYWQASRIQTLLGNAAQAIGLANVCLFYSGELAPFYLGYAHEALARSHQLAGDHQNAKHHLKQALELAARIAKQDDRELLETDLNQLNDRKA
jgi:hypothetical protein